MRVVFADTFYFLALINPSDQYHQKALGFTRAFKDRMLTTDWVITELADALAGTPRGRSEALATLADLQADPDATIVPFSSTLMSDGLDLYARRPDKQWSLTDCVSFVVMQREGIAEALTGDQHFVQAGFVALLK
jgi:predicted nucleic acid-binding protein